MTAWLLTIALAAGPVTLATPGFTVSGMPADQGNSFSEYLTTQIALGRVAHLRVITPKEISALLGLERQALLVGCSNTECMTEIASGLGSDTLLIGDLALLGSRYVATLKVIRVKDGNVLSIQSVEAANKDDFLRALKAAAARLADDTFRAFGVEPVGLSSGPSRNWAIAPAALFLGSGIVAPILFGQSESRYALLSVHDHPIGSLEANTARDEGRTLQSLGWAAAVTAVVMLGIAAVWWFAIGERP